MGIVIPNSDLCVYCHWQLLLMSVTIQHTGPYAPPQPLPVIHLDIRIAIHQPLNLPGSIGY